MAAPAASTICRLDSPFRKTSVVPATDVLSVALSSPVLMSVSLAPVTVAVLLITSVPMTVDESTVNVTVSVALAPAARSWVQVPSEAVVSTKLPALGTAESRVTPLGKVRSSLRVTPVASEGPALKAVTVYTRLPAPEPAMTVPTDSVLLTWMSTSGVSVSVSVALSLVASGSVTLDTLAVLARLPVALGSTVPVAA